MMKLARFGVLCVVLVAILCLNVRKLPADRPPQLDSISFVGEVVELKKVHHDRERDGFKEHIRNEVFVKVIEVKQGPVRKGQLVLCDHPMQQSTQKGETPNVEVPKVGTQYRIHSPSELERFTGRDCMHLSGCRVMELPKEE